MDQRQLLSRDRRTRLVLWLTDRDLAQHVDESWSCPELVDVASGCSLFRLDPEVWDAIHSAQWREGGFLLRLGRIDGDGECCLVLDPPRERFALSKGFEGQMFGDELPEAELEWQAGWGNLAGALSARFTPATPATARAPSIRIEHEYVELSMVHRQYWATVHDGSTGEALFSLPMGQWSCYETGGPGGEVLFELVPDGRDRDHRLLYDPAARKIRRLGGATGATGPWLPAARAGDAW